MGKIGRNGGRRMRRKRRGLELNGEDGGVRNREDDDLEGMRRRGEIGGEEEEKRERRGRIWLGE